MTRFFRSYIAPLGLLIVLSIVTLVSIGLTSSSLGRKEWVSGSGGLAKRQSTITFTIPWDGGKVHNIHENLIEETSTSTSTNLPTADSNYNDGPFDFLPSTTTTTSGSSSTSSIHGTYVSTPTPAPAETSDCTETDTATTSLCLNCGLKGIETGTGLPGMLGYITPSQSIASSSSAIPSLTSASYNYTADMPYFATPMGYVCRPQLVTTQSALGCSVCTTVTETWHSTDYSCTATSIISVAEITVTVMVTANSPLNMPASANSALPKTTSGSNTHWYLPCPSTITFVSVPGPPPPMISPNLFSFLNSAPSLHNLFPNLKASTTAVATTSAHPCPNAGYSCSECPGGWFCPPIQTPAMSCPCGYGWACANCVGGWYCVPGPTSTSVSVATSAVSVLGNSTGLNRISGAVTGVAVPITGGVFSIIEHITATTALTSFNSMVVPLGTTVPSIPSITSDTVSIITTPVPVAPLILPGASVSGVKTLKRRVLQRAENSVTEEAYNDPEKRRR